MARSVKGRPAEASEATRNALLDAGRRILLDQPASGVFSHLTATRVASEANRTTGALFHQWATLEDYVGDLITRLFDPSQSETFPELVSTIGAVMSSGGTLLDGILAASRHALDVMPHDPHTIVELLMWNRASRDDEFRAMVASLYPKLDAMGGAFIEAMLEVAGREMRPPYTAEVFAALCAGILQGIAIREVMTPGFYPRDVAGHVLLTLVPLFTRVPGDDKDADELTMATPIEAQGVEHTAKRRRRNLRDRGRPAEGGPPTDDARRREG
jgi:AcrR family transcriptional regulator